MLGPTLGRAADVEGPHGELSARLADRLRRDHANRLADVDHGTARQVAPVTRGADSALGLAGKCRADQHLVEPGALDQFDRILLDQDAGLDDDIA